MSKLTIIKIRCRAPSEATKEEIAEFVTDALESMGGCRHPEDVMFDSLSVQSLIIRGQKFENPEPNALSED